MIIFSFVTGFILANIIFFATLKPKKK